MKEKLTYLSVSVLFTVLLASLPTLEQAAPTDEGGGSELPPGSYVTPEMVERYRKTIDARARGEAGDLAPDKLEDQWTSSKTLRKDLAEQLVGFADNLTVLEVGSYFGYTTRLLSQLFKRVIALDAMPQLLQANRDFNADRDNIMFLKFHTINDDWAVFATNTIHVVFLDASHDYDTVRLDVEHCLRYLPSVSIMIFDDYGAEIGVRAAVHEFIANGKLRPIAMMGEGAEGPWKLSDGRTIEDREAIAVEVVRE